MPRKNGASRNVVKAAGSKKSVKKKAPSKRSAAGSNTLQALRDHQALFKLALTSAQVGLWELDLKTNRVKWSDNVNIIFGIDPNTFRTVDSYLNFIHEDDRQALVESIEYAIRTKGKYKSQHRVIFPDGSLHWFEGNGKVVLNSKGAPVKICGSLQDITAAKVSAMEKEDWKIRYEMIASSSGQVVYDYDIPTGNIVWSGMIREVLGYTAAEMGDISTWGELIHPEDRSTAFAELDRAEKSLLPYDVNYRFLKKDGAYVNLHDKGLFVANGQGKAYRMLGVMQDITERVRATNVLREREKSYHELFDTVDEAIYLQNIDGTFIDVNKGACKMYGYPKEDFIGRTPEFLSAEGKNDLAALGVLFGKVLEGTPQVFEWWGKRKNGEIFLKEVQLSKGSHEGKDIMIATARDVTKQREAVGLLKESEKRFRDLIRDLNIGVTLRSANSQIILYNKVALEMLDLTGDQLRGKVPFPPGWKASHEDGSDFPDIEFPVMQAIQAKKPVRDIVMGVFRPSRQDYAWLLINAEPIFNNAGDLSEVICSFTDITIRKKYEEELQESEQRFRTLQQASFGGIGLHDHGIIIDCNQGLCDITGYSYDELVGRNGLELIAPEFRPEVMEKIRSNYEKTYDVEGIRRDGTRYILEIHGKQIPYQGRNIRVTEFRDITERKRAEEQILEQNARLQVIAEDLKRKNEQLEEFTQIVSHNLRAPVGNILTLISFLEAAQTTDEKIEYIHYLKESSALILTTLHELNDVLKIKQDKNIEKQQLKFEDVFNHVKMMLITKVTEVQADLGADFSQAPTIWYPNIYLESIFLNLLSNSLKYVYPGRKPVIRFKTYYQGENLIMDVSDNGLGIDLNRYGHQVFKLRKTFHRHPESRGVGLFMIKNQIEAMGGEIMVASQENQGTTFHINFNKHLNDDE